METYVEVLPLDWKPPEVNPIQSKLGNRGGRKSNWNQIHMGKDQNLLVSQKHSWMNDLRV